MDPGAGLEMRNAGSSEVPSVPVPVPMPRRRKATSSSSVASEQKSKEVEPVSPPGVRTRQMKRAAAAKRQTAAADTCQQKEGTSASTLHGLTHL